MATITRFDTNQRMSQAVVYGDTVYLAGQVAEGDGAAAQTAAILEKIDGLLARAGSDKNHLIKAEIWLASMSDFAEMNAVWDAWVPEGAAPARACGESALATPDFRVEIMITAAVKG